MTAVGATSVGVTAVKTLLNPKLSLTSDLPTFFDDLC